MTARVIHHPQQSRIQPTIQHQAQHPRIQQGIVLNVPDSWLNQPRRSQPQQQERPQIQPKHSLQPPQIQEVDESDSDDNMFQDMDRIENNYRQ